MKKLISLLIAGAMVLGGCDDSRDREKVLVLRYNSKGQVIEAYSSTRQNVHIWDNRLVEICVRDSSGNIDKRYFVPMDQATVVINEPNLDKEGQFIRALEAPQENSESSM